MRRKTVVDGEAIMRSGETAAAAWRVISGTFQVQGPGPDGQPVEYLAVAGDVIGAAAMLDGTQHEQTAVARGSAVAEMLPREEAMRLLGRSPEAAGRMLAALFAASETAAAPAGPAAAAHAAGLRLYGLEEPLAGILGRDGIAVEYSPFLVGRKESEDDDGLGRGMHLVLADNRPYHLSRRHFAIERKADGWVVRDCGSFHGTYVNGLLVGASEAHSAAKLTPGDNVVIAGSLKSPFRFRIALGGQTGA